MKQIRINAKDYTSVFTEAGYTVSYIKRKGNNGGVMLDGTYLEDVLGFKAVVTCYCMPTNETQLQELLTDIANEYVQLDYFDPKMGDYKSISAIPSEPVQKYRGSGVNALEYWTGTVITFTER